MYGCSTPMEHRQKLLETEELFTIQAAYESYRLFTACLPTLTSDFGKMQPARIFKEALDATTYNQHQNCGRAQ